MSFFDGEIDLDMILNKSSEQSSIAKKWFIEKGRLDEDQRKVFDEKDESFIVKGCAGSGKSILLLHRLFKLLIDRDEDYDSYLVTMYTKALRVFFQDGLDIFLKDNEEFEHLYNKKIKKENIIHTEAMKADFLDESKEYLLIDEYQDISKGDFEKMIKSFEKFLIFGDDEQRLYDNVDYIDIQYIKEQLGSNIKVHELNTTYRLPYDIASYAEEIIGSKISSKCYNKEIGSNLPYVVECTPTIGKTYFENEIDFVVREIYEKDLKDIGILIHDSENLSIAKEILKNKIEDIYGKHNTEKYPKIRYKINTDVSKLKFDQENSITLLVFHSSKGTEFENVFVIKCDNESIWGREHCYDTALFVACTRTNKNLYITHSKEITPFLKNIYRKKYKKYIYKNRVLKLQEQ